MVTMPGVGNFSSGAPAPSDKVPEDRKSTRLNSSHLVISYAVFCLKKKKINHIREPLKQLIPTHPTKAYMLRRPASIHFGWEPSWPFVPAPLGSPAPLVVVFTDIGR